MTLAILDSDTLSEVLKGKNSVVVDNANRYLALHGRFAISAMTRFEVLRGLLDKNAQQQTRQFETFCANAEIVPIGDPILDKSAELWVIAKQAGRSRYDADLIIAATALILGRDLVTGNTADYTWIPGLKLVDWRTLQP